MSSEPEPVVRRPSDPSEDLIRRARSGDVGVVRIEDRDEAVAMLADLGRATRSELWSTLPGGPYRLEMLRSSWDDDLALLQRGVRCRVVYQSDSARSPDVLRYLTDFAAQGARIRVAPLVRLRTVVSDRRTAVVATEEGSLRPPVLVVTEPALIRQFLTEFEVLWRGAHAVGAGPQDVLSAELVRETVEHLRSGSTDEAVARRLGVSVRTVRRRIAAVMSLLGASSRFEAGVKASEAGLL